MTASTAAHAVSAAVRGFAREVGTHDPVRVVGSGTHAALVAARAASPEPPQSERPTGASGSADATRSDRRPVREVRAPAGVWEYDPAEMTVRCGAGTVFAELAEALAVGGQMTPLDPADPQATVGGVLACGVSGPRRLRYGHVRDLVLRTRHIDADGQMVTAGGPTVKNVSGYDLCRLLVGSYGTLGFLAEVILRTLPLPLAQQWMTAPDADPFVVLDTLYRPSSVLWDGRRCWVCLEGHPTDVDAEARKLSAAGFAVCDAGPVLPSAGRWSLSPGALRRLGADASLNSAGFRASHGAASCGDESAGTGEAVGAGRDAGRWSLSPGALRRLGADASSNSAGFRASRGAASCGDESAGTGEAVGAGRGAGTGEAVGTGRGAGAAAIAVPTGEWIAEVGVGVVHCSHAVTRDTAPPITAAIMSDLKRRLDPTGRLNPGLRPW